MNHAEFSADYMNKAHWLAEACPFARDRRARTYSFEFISFISTMKIRLAFFAFSFWFWNLDFENYLD